MASGSSEKQQTSESSIIPWPPWRRPRRGPRRPRLPPWRGPRRLPPWRGPLPPPWPPPPGAMSPGGVTLTSDYYDALKLGEILVVYGRLMMIGAGGAGKTSLLHALMNEPLPNHASSTLLANACTVKRHFANAGDQAGQNWVEVGEDDEVNELATYLQRILKLQSSTPASSSPLASLLEDVPAFSDQSHPSAGEVHVSEAKSRKVVEKILLAIKQRSRGRSESSSAEVLLHIWDSGGQVVFMNILPAFLTSRTLYTLVFDASKDLDEKLTVVTHRGGQIVNTEPYHLSSIELLLQWMASIHSHLARQNPDGKLEPYPRVLLVGTRRDKLSVDRDDQFPSEKSVRNNLASLYKGKYHSEILLWPLPLYIVDNTTAGRGINEDPSFKEIRQRVHEFTSDNLAVKTPLTWVLFRKVMQSICKDDQPVVSYKEAAAIAKACYIPSEAFPSVLNFYHELGVFLYYTKIPRLKDWVFTNPQWLISQFAKLLCPQGLEDQGRPEVWKEFRKYGILVDELYEDVLSGHLMDPQGLVDLLEKFLLAAPLETSRFSDRFPFKVEKVYFVPCMLSAPIEKATESDTAHEREEKLHTRDAFMRAEPLHLVFNTNYVPPGFFVRLVTSLAKSQRCKILFDLSDRCSVVYAYDEVNEFEVKEGTNSIVIHAIRCIQGRRVPLFTLACQAIMQLLISSIREVSEWFRYVKVNTAFRCTTCKQQGQHNHFVVFTSSDLYLRCQIRHIVSSPTTEQQHWMKQGSARTAHSIKRSSVDENAPTSKDCSVLPKKQNCDEGDDRPTMMELVGFVGRERWINIPQEISTKYLQFGILLLEDSTGTRIRSIEYEERNVPERINMAVLQQWIAGKGKHPVTWRTLVGTLYRTQLNSLASEIKEVKFPEMLY